MSAHAKELRERMKIYLAGPDVFRPDVTAWAESAHALCRSYGFEPLLPVDHAETHPERICEANLALIRKAQIVAANLDSFRGAEPDSGTCFELGYAHAQAKKLFGYVTGHMTVVDRVARQESRRIEDATDKNGWAIENFELPANLMLASSMQIVEGGLEACLKAIRPR
jgi:nucleoside 2-deoxyribosyltransferase